MGDTVHIGGTLSSARQHEFTVVGISPTFGSFLGTPTVTLRLSELQQVTGTTGTDPATFVLIRTEADASVTDVQADLQRDYPEYSIYTNREQLDAVLSHHTMLIASGVTFIVLAIAAGLALTVTVLALILQQQRRELAALAAIGIPRRSIAGVIAAHGLVLGAIGGICGLVLTPVAAYGLNRVAHGLFGFDGLVVVPTIAFAIGAMVAIIIGVSSATVIAWRFGDTPPLDTL